MTASASSTSSRVRPLLSVLMVGALISACDTGTSWDKPWTEERLRNELNDRASLVYGFEATVAAVVPCEFLMPPVEGSAGWQAATGLELVVGRTGNSTLVETGERVMFLMNAGFDDDHLSEQPSLVFGREMELVGATVTMDCADGAPLAFEWAYGLWPQRAPDRMGLLSHEDAYDVVESWRGRMETPEKVDAAGWADFSNLEQPEEAPPAP